LRRPTLQVLDFVKQEEHELPATSRLVASAAEKGSLEPIHNPQNGRTEIVHLAKIIELNTENLPTLCSQIERILHEMKLRRGLAKLPRSVHDHYGRELPFNTPLNLTYKVSSVRRQ
jgi:hypothetical protein